MIPSSLLKVIIPYIFFFFLYSLSYGQVIYETNSQSIYKFLNRLDQKKIIQLNTNSYPYTKKLIKNKLKELYSKKEQLNIIEMENLNWFIEKYSLEADRISHNFGEYNYQKDQFRAKVFPIAGAGIMSIAGELGHTRKVGLNLEGYYSNNFGIFFQYLDTGEFNDFIDRNKFFNSDTWHNPKYLSNGSQFSDVRGQINYNWNWGVISLKKDYNKWGAGKYGQLALSNKVASYPHIELSLHPTDWLSLNFIHGWLNSQVIDSSKSSFDNQSDISNKIFEEFRTKYITANYLTIMPNDYLIFSMGNAFIYSGELRPEMFLPLMYYKVLDHNTGRTVGDGNGTLFLDASLKYPQNFKFYGSIIFDVYQISYLLDESAAHSWIGYTVGASVTDLLLDNFDLTIEYTRTDPWLYENQYEVVNYKHMGYTLGHWIGQNADLLTFGIDYSAMRGMDISITGQWFRKGSMRDIYFAYKKDSEKIPFLDGDKRTEFNLKLEVYYEALYNLYIQGRFQYSNISDEDIYRTPSYLLENSNSFQLTIAYGLPF